MDIKILEPIKNYLKEFNTTEEFNNFYSLNKDELNSQTTHKLNKLYHVKGYRITKIKGELMLKKWDESKSTGKVVSEEPTISENEIEELREEIKKIKAAVNKIITFLNESS